MSTKDPIKFTCPSCGAKHERGYVNGVDTFRCLRCGYSGHGFHPDPATDADIGSEIRANQALDASLGIAPGAFEP